MFEKVNPDHPDKIADRIAGAIVDQAYRQTKNPRVAVEVLIGHGVCHIINETSEHIKNEIVENIVARITGHTGLRIIYQEVPQDDILSINQKDIIRCGDNGIFKGVPVTQEQLELTNIAREIYNKYPSDGKYILNNADLTICQSNADKKELYERFPGAKINPIGNWTGGFFVDTGATNRKLGSDMGDSITGGGLHGKDFSKADVSINIYAFLKAQKLKRPVSLFCSIGDIEVDGHPYSYIVDTAREYIRAIGGFERFAEWGLIR